MHVALITNPRSGRQRGPRAAVAAEEVFREAGWEVEIHLTTAHDDAVRMAAKCAEGGVDAVFAAGGDGTLSQVLTGLLDTGVPAGVIPAGTGNDLARTLGLSLEPALAAAQLVQGAPEPVDLMEIDGGRWWAVNVLGIGFDSRVAGRMARKSRAVGGIWAYLLAVAGEFAAFRSTRMKLTVDDQHWEGPALLTAIGNARSYGAGMKITPQAEIDDGWLDVVVVGAMSRLQFLRNFPRVMHGTHLSHPAVHTWRGKSIHLEAEEPVPINVDGDLRGETPLSVRVAPGRALLWRPGPVTTKGGPS